MIDTWGVLANSLWIAGLAILLAALSWAHWMASVKSSRLRVALAGSAARRMRSLGSFLFCAGLAATGRAWWEWALWGGLTLWFAVRTVLPERG